MMALFDFLAESLKKLEQLFDSTETQNQLMLQLFCVEAPHLQISHLCLYLENTFTITVTTLGSLTPLHLVCLPGYIQQSLLHPHSQTINTMEKTHNQAYWSHLKFWSLTQMDWLTTDMQGLFTEQSKLKIANNILNGTIYS